MIEKVDPELVVLDADMDMHAADHQPPRHVLEIAGEHVVALACRYAAGSTIGKRMGRCGDRRQPELIGDAADGAAQMDQLVARLLHRSAHLGADLDLRAQELRADLAAQRLLAFGEQRRRRLRGEVAAVLVDEEIFLLHADGEAGFLDGHGTQCGTNGKADGRGLDEARYDHADQIGHGRCGDADQEGLFPRSPPGGRRPITPQ